MPRKMIKDLIVKEEINVGGRWVSVESSAEDLDKPGNWKIIHGHGVISEDPNHAVEWRKPEM